MNECPNCGSPDVYVEFEFPYSGVYRMHCNACDTGYEIEMGSEED